MLLAWAWRALGPLARWLPPSVAYRLSAVIMAVVYAGWPAGRRAMQANLRHVLGTNDAAVLGRASRAQLRRYGELLVDEARLPALTAADCFHAVQTTQWPELDAALAGDQPVIFALTHFGNWEVAGGALSYRLRDDPAGRRLHVLTESVGHPGLNRAMHRAREGLGMVPLDIDRRPLAALRALRRGHPVGILIDRPLPPGAPGVDVTMFGARCRLPAGMARLALATEARVVPLAMARVGRDFRFVPLVDFEFRHASSGERGADVQALTQAVVDVHAEWVRSYPDQWYQFRSFFGPFSRTS